MAALWISLNRIFRQGLTRVIWMKRCDSKAFYSVLRLIVKWFFADLRVGCSNLIMIECVN